MNDTTPSATPKPSPAPAAAAAPAAHTRRRSPTADQLRVWRSFIETAESVRAITGSRLQSESGVSNADYSVLLALSEAEGRRLRPSALADTIEWERSRLSHHLGRMERRGLVERTGSTTDSRGADVLLTDDGLTTFRRASAPHMHAIQQIFVEALTQEQLAALGDATAALRAHLDQGAAGAAAASAAGGGATHGAADTEGAATTNAAS